MKDLNATPKKYYIAICSLHDVLKYTEKLNLNEFCKVNKLNNRLPQALFLNVILRKTGETRASTYKWIGPKPSLEMAEMLLTSINDIHGKRKLNYPIKIFSESNQNIIDFTVTRYLFGLIQIRTRYHYKTAGHK